MIYNVEVEKITDGLKTTTAEQVEASYWIVDEYNNITLYLRQLGETSKDKFAAFYPLNRVVSIKPNVSPMTIKPVPDSQETK